MLTILTNSYAVSREFVHLLRKLKPDEIALIVVPAFDYEANGVHVSPALSSLVRKLMAKSIRTTYRFYEMLKMLGFADTKIADFDLALFTSLTLWIGKGNELTEFYSKINSELGIGYRIYPLTDTLTSTVIETESGNIDPVTYYEMDEPPETKGVRFEKLEASKIPDVVKSVMVESQKVLLFQPSVLTIAYLRNLSDFIKLTEEHKGTMICLLPKTLTKADQNLLKFYKKTPDWKGLVDLLEEITDIIIFDETKASIIQSALEHKMTFYPISYETSERGDLENFVNNVLKLSGVESK